MSPRDRSASIEGRVGRTHCAGCGSATCPGCRRAFDPPRFCPDCGRRLTVAVHPGGYRAVCRDHGELASEPGRTGRTG